MIELVETRESHRTTMRELMLALARAGGNLDTPLLIEADGEPVTIAAYLPARKPWGFDFSKLRIGG